MLFQSNSYSLILCFPLIGEVGRGSFSGDEVNSTVMLDSEDFMKLFTGELNPAQAYLGGKLQLTGSMHKFMKLENQLLQKMKSKL